MKKIAFVLIISMNYLTVLGQDNTLKFIWITKSTNGLISTEKNEILIESVIISSKDIRNQVRVLLNNSDITNKKTIGEVSLNQEGEQTTFSVKIKLKEGLNEIQLMVNQQKSSILKVQYIVASKPNLYLVCVGVNSRLIYAKKDAEDIFKTFKSQYGYLFQKVEGELLVCPKNTGKTKIASTISNLRKVSLKNNDVILLFFSSHGRVLGSDDFGLETNDSDNGTDERYSLISYQKDIIDNIKDLPCKQIIMIDACHSGSAKNGEKGSTISNIAEAQRIMNQTPASIITLVSSSKQEVSYENVKWGHGAFTSAILEGLNGQADAPENKDFMITVEELTTYVKSRVFDLTTDPNLNLDSPQHPRLVSELIHDFPIFNYNEKRKDINAQEENCENEVLPKTSKIKSKIAILALKSGNKEIDWELMDKVSDKIKWLKPEMEVAQLIDESLVKGGTFMNFQSGQISLPNTFSDNYGDYLYIITKETVYKNNFSQIKIIYNAKTDIRFVKYDIKNSKIIARFRADENPTFKSEIDKDKAESLATKLTLGELTLDNFK
jgi:Caspase domain